MPIDPANPFVMSASEPGRRYRMVATPGGIWTHADKSCRGFNGHGICRHIREANDMSESRAVATRGHEDEDEDNNMALTVRQPMALFYNVEKLTAGVAPQVAAKWIYDIDQGNSPRIRGVGGQGAEEGQRFLALQGEVIEIVECVIIREDDEEALFQATAERWEIDEDGKRRGPFGRTTRGKRVPKTMRLRSGAIIPDNDWYSKGLTKATRNVILAMTPGNVKTAILAAGLEANRVLAASAGSSASTPETRERRAREERAAPPAPPPNPDAMRASQDAQNVVLRLLREIQQSVAEGDYARLWGEIDKEFPKARQGRAVKLTDLTATEIAGLERKLRYYMGEPPPEEEGPPTEEEGPPDVGE